MIFLETFMFANCWGFCFESYSLLPENLWFMLAFVSRSFSTVKLLLFSFCIFKFFIAIPFLKSWDEMTMGVTWGFCGVYYLYPLWYLWPFICLVPCSASLMNRSDGDLPFFSDQFWKAICPSCFFFIWFSCCLASTLLFWYFLIRDSSFLIWELSNYFCIQIS